MVFDNQKKKWIFVLILLSLLILTVYMLNNYLAPLFVGALIAYFLHPIYTKLHNKVKSKMLAQTILSIGSVLLLFVILTALITPLVSQTQLLYHKTEQYMTLDENQACLNPDSQQCSIVSLINTYLEDQKENGKEIISKISDHVVGNITTLLNSTLQLIVSIIVVMFSIFYFLDYGKDIKNTILSTLPLKPAHKNKIFNRLKETISAVVGGNISTALLQGIAGGIIFAILGIPLAIFWGFVMFILAFIPSVGPALVWLPTVVILALTGSIVKSLILLAYCLIVLGYIDNILKPKLIGNKIKLSSFAIFLGVLGGLQVFGILGLFFGPIIIALLVTCLDIYREMG